MKMLMIFSQVRELKHIILLFNYILYIIIYIINSLLSFLAKEFKTAYYDDVTNGSGLKGQGSHD